MCSPRARAAARGVLVGRAIHIDQAQDSGAPTEAFDLQLQTSGFFELHAGDATRQITRLAPASERHDVAALGQSKRIGRNREWILARIQ